MKDWYVLSSILPWHTWDVITLGVLCFHIAYAIHHPSLSTILDSGLTFLASHVKYVYVYINAARTHAQHVQHSVLPMA